MKKLKLPKWVGDTLDTITVAVGALAFFIAIIAVATLVVKAVWTL